MINNAGENLIALKRSKEIKTPEEKGNGHTIMTVQEVAEYLRICRFSVYNLVKRGELPAIKVLNKLRFTRKAVEEYLNDQKLIVKNK